MANHLNMSEEEVDAEIERMQQQLTLALQHIDENFASCNQNASKLSAEIDRYGEASQEMRNNSQKWLYFLQTMTNEHIPNISDDETEGSTNRPTIDDDSFPYQHNRDITNHNMTSTFDGLLRKSLRKNFTSPNTMDTTTSGKPTYPIIDMNSPSGSSNTSSLRSRRRALSPPRTIPFGIPDSQLLGTPIREQAAILTENTLRSVGIRSSDDESDGGPFHPDTPSRSSLPGSQRSFTPKKLKTTDKRTAEEEERTNKAWEISNMDTDDTESRANFVKFLEQRNKLQDLPDPSIFKQPYLPSSSNKRFRADDEEDRIRHSRIPSEEPSPTLFRHEVSHSPQFQPDMTPSPRQQQGEEEEEEDVAAYEFSDGLPQYNYSNSFHTGSLSDRSSNHSLKSLSEQQSTTAQIPIQFNLQYFPEQFRTPPGSIKLTKVYNEFNKRPGTLLTVQDIITTLNDPTYKEEFVSLLISLLARKKFIKKVGNREAWVIRR